MWNIDALKRGVSQFIDTIQGQKKDLPFVIPGHVGVANWFSVNDLFEYLARAACPKKTS